MELNAEFSVSELLDLTDKFQSRILGVCTARNDIAHINSLMDMDSSDTNFTIAFLFRQQIAMIREALLLVYYLFKDHINELKEFNNFMEIEKEYEELRKITDSFQYTSGTIIHDFLKPVRDQVNHYKDEKTQYHDLATEVIPSTFTLFDEKTPQNCYGRQYTFTDNVFYRSAMKKWKKYRKLASDDFGSTFMDFVLRYRDIVVDTILLLDAIFDGYCDKNLDIEQTESGYKFIKKTI